MSNRSRRFFSSPKSIVPKYFSDVTPKNVMTLPRHYRITHLSNVVPLRRKPELLPETVTRIINIDKGTSHTRGSYFVLVDVHRHQSHFYPTRYIPRIGKYMFRIVTLNAFLFLFFADLHRKT